MPRNTSGLRRGGPGRPKAAHGLRAELVRRYGEDGQALVARLDELARGRTPKVALSATELLLAYLAGKPPQTIEHQGEGGGPVQVIYRLAGATE